MPKSEEMPENLDFIDLQLLATLQARPHSVIDPLQVNLSRPTRRMRNRAEGVIIGYHARINPVALNQAYS